jgi:hypothetical protein
MQTANSGFPKTSFESSDTMGAKAKLLIESDGVWVESDSGEKEKIFSSELNQTCYPEIPG